MFLDIPCAELLQQDDPESYNLPSKYYFKIQRLQQQLMVMEGLNFILHHSDRISVWLLEMLEQQGIVLGNGAFVLMKIHTSVPFFPMMPENSQLPVTDRFDHRPTEIDTSEFTAFIRQRIGGICRVYMFSDCGCLYALMCLQGETERDSKRLDDFFESLDNELSSILKEGEKLGFNDLRIYVSKVRYTAKSISSTYDDVNTLEEYCAYCESRQTICIMRDYPDSREDWTYVLAHQQRLIYNMASILKKEKKRIWINISKPLPIP